MRYFICFFLILQLSACSYLSVQHNPETVFSDKTAYSALGSIVVEIEERDTSKFEILFHSEIKESETIKDDLSALVSALPEGDLDFELFYAENRIGLGEYAGVPIYYAVYEAKTSAGYLQLDLAVAEENGRCCVGTYIWIYPMSAQQPSKVNDLTLSSKAWIHYLVATLAAGVLLLIVVTAIKCAFASNTSRKWLWLPFILLGLWGVHFNWTTAEIQPSFISITENSFHVSIIELQLLGVGVTTSGPFRPWVVEIGAPVGALLYWFFPRLRTRREVIPEIDSL